MKNKYNIIYNYICRKWFIWICCNLYIAYPAIMTIGLGVILIMTGHAEGVIFADVMITSLAIYGIIKFIIYKKKGKKEVKCIN